MTDFTIIRRSMTSRLFSTVTTIVTVAVAVGLMLVLLSMRDAGRRAFSRGSGNMHLLVSRDQSPLVSVLNGLFYANAPRAPISWSEYQRIAGQHPFDFAIPVQLGDSYRAQYPAVATAADFFTAFHPAPDAHWTFAQGRAFAADFEVILGSAAAHATGHKIGDQIVLTHGIAQSRGSGGSSGSPHVHDEFKYTVVGILAPTGTAHDRALFTNLQSAWLIHAFDRRERAEHHAEGTGAGAAEPAGHDEHEAPITPADLIPEDRKITDILVRVPTRPGSDVSAAVGPVAAGLVRDTSFSPPLTVAEPVKEINKLFVIVGSIDQLLLAMAAVVMVSSGIGIMLALYNSMEQRRRQIAVLRVLGCSRGRVFGLVVTEATLIGIFGAAAGLVLSVAGAWLVSGVMKARLGLVIQPSLGPEWVLPVVVGSIVLAAAAGLVPAGLAYRVPVAKNLKPLG